MPNGRYTDIIERLKPKSVLPGDIVHIDGRVLGRHDGIIHFTVGQRRGLGLAAGEPLYVLKLDAERAAVIVGPREMLATGSIFLGDLNWIGDGELEQDAAPLEVAVRVRSTRAPRPAFIRRTAEGVFVDLPSAEEGVAPGQACVVYESTDTRSRVLGGGTIRRTRPAVPMPTAGMTADSEIAAKTL